MPTADPEGGGGEELTGAWEHIDSYPSTELQGISKVIDVQEVITRALPSNVIFTLRFLPEAYVPEIVDSLRGQFAGYFNAMSEIPGVAAVTTYQDVDDADQIQDVMQLVVKSTSGKSTFPLVETPFGRRLDYITDDVTAKVAELDKIEKGS